jgi:hypothetical protein
VCVCVCVCVRVRACVRTLARAPQERIYQFVPKLAHLFLETRTGFSKSLNSEKLYTSMSRRGQFMQLDKLAR